MRSLDSKILLASPCGNCVCSHLIAVKSTHPRRRRHIINCLPSRGVGDGETCTAAAGEVAACSNGNRVAATVIVVRCRSAAASTAAISTVRLHNVVARWHRVMGVHKVPSALEFCWARAKICTSKICTSMSNSRIERLLDWRTAFNVATVQYRTGPGQRGHKRESSPAMCLSAQTVPN